MTLDGGCQMRFRLQLSFSAAAPVSRVIHEEEKNETLVAVDSFFLSSFGGALMVAETHRIEDQRLFRSFLLLYVTSYSFLCIYLRMREAAASVKRWPLSFYIFISKETSI